jgi:hypothetical protein
VLLLRGFPELLCGRLTRRCSWRRLPVVLFLAWRVHLKEDFIAAGRSTRRSHTRSISQTSTHLIAAVEEALAPLTGLVMWGPARAATMVSLQFGEPRKAPTARAPERLVGEYALHIQTPWRLSGAIGVIAGSADMHEPIDPDVPDEDFRFDIPGSSVLDHQLKRWSLAARSAPRRVVRVQVDRCAGFSLSLSEADERLEVFPDAFALPHYLREHWRVFQPDRESSHFVVTNHGWGPPSDG